ncbi:hypothetical protein SPRG_02554 [Saprolegnia parasitica CBS 223.65]|uniref:chitin synthase n=1 Tax=Saprolegnia parasitica (strain CBS 223.65) TaxID=695850 RepID=A0A067D285_SAPPC|nr:hypothetical protein SPRG_02554 [Saprolegnia parasitica CBS 223.65]KDO32861.1 hypothetical protein SPRG_02554 [Saprolegnia parasitica CBS 223.65]|eukprot:XP_012196513.1 hypothetical protein SPRG_02554 [Saprolegnia parasitica CBS 223.65]
MGVPTLSKASVFRFARQPRHHGVKTRLLRSRSKTLMLGGQSTAETAQYASCNPNGDETSSNSLKPLKLKDMSTDDLLRHAEQLDMHLAKIYIESQKTKALAPIVTKSIGLPQQLWEDAGVAPPYHSAAEFQDLRYTAVRTADPIAFSADGYSLRVHTLGKSIKVFITVTMYNEPASQLQATLTGLAGGIDYLCHQYGYDFWQEVAVVVVADGRSKTHHSVLPYLESFGAFEKNLLAQAIAASKDTHLIFALKEHNAGKLHSHLWFFNAFSEQVDPTYTALVDVGTVPAESSVYRLIRSMERNPQIGGVAGEIAVDDPDFFNPVIAAQHFEYKIANIMDASLQSVFGFIGVLPGAFSAYRYEAIRPINGVGPLAEYFKSLTASKKELGLCVGNMYLAEDRILCFEILARKNCDWTMHYVKDAIAHTDVPETLVDLIKQRRRWLNGSFFAGLFAIWNFGRVWTQSAHSLPRKCAFSLQFLYLAFQNVMNWFLLSNLFLTFFYILSLALYYKSIELLHVVLGTYFVLVGSLIVFALGNKPGHRTAIYYRVSSYIMGTIMLCVTCISLYALLGNVQFVDPRSDLPSCSVSNYELEAGAFFSLGIIFVCAFMHGEFGIVRSTVQYFFMLPTFVNVLGIYAYSNLHDLSWGTKGIETSAGHNGLPTSKFGSVKDMVALHLNATSTTDVVSEADKRKGVVAAEHEDVDNRFRVFRSLLLLTWLLTNGCWLYYATSFISCSCYLKYLSYIVAVFNTFRFLGGLLFLSFRMARGALHCCRQGVKKTRPLRCGNPQAGDDCSPV